MDDLTDKWKYLLATLDLDSFAFEPVEPKLIPVVNHLFENLRRVNASHRFPIFVAGMSRLWAEHFEQVCREHGIPYGQEEIPATCDHKAILTESHRRVHVANSKDPGYLNLEENGEKAMQLIFLDYQEGRDFRAAIFAVLQSMVINAWTAIEVMIGQLHEVTTDGWPPPSADAREQSWRIMTLAKGNGCPCGPPREWKEGALPNLSSLEGARQAYAVAFTVDCAEIDQCMSDLAFEELYRLRNQFVHEAGMITSSFKKYTKKLRTFDAYKKGFPIILSGEDTKRFIENALKMSVNLIRSVDTWLQSHQSIP